MSVILQFIQILGYYFTLVAFTKGASEFDTGSDLVPCLASNSIIFNGNCLQCIQPNQFDIPHCGKIGRNESEAVTADETSSQCNDNIYLCPTEQSDVEQIKINEGKRYLNQRTIRVVTVERCPFVKIINGNYTGVILEYLYALQLKYNFTSNIFLPYDGNWGAETDNGTWNGMIGQVLRNEAELGANAFSVTLERAKVIAFSMPFHQEPTAILIPAPIEGNKLAILIRPLSNEVWLAVFTTILVLVPFLFMMHIASLHIRGELTKLKMADAVRLILDLFQFTVGSLVQESIISPVSKSSRFLVVIWWFFTLILANIYVGYMVSFLSAPKLYDIIDSLEGLVHQKSLRWTYRKNTALEDLFQVSIQEFNQFFEKEFFPLAPTQMVYIDGVMKTLTGHFAYIKEKSYLDVALSADLKATKTCRMTVAKETFFTVGFAFVLQKGSVLLELFDKEILNSVNTGLMAKWKAIHWPNNLQCVDAAAYIVSTQPKTRKLTFDDCQGAYFLLMCGLSAAITSFLVERLKTFLNKNLVQPISPKKQTSVIGDEDHYKIIVIPVKDEYYRKLSVLDATHRILVGWAKIGPQR